MVYKKYDIEKNNALFKQAKEFWATHLKSMMTFDEYFAQIRPQIQAYIDLDTQEEKNVMLSTKRTMLDRTHRGIIKQIRERKGK